jgi:hypothetical protein
LTKGEVAIGAFFETFLACLTGDEERVARESRVETGDEERVARESRVEA